MIGKRLVNTGGGGINTEEYFAPVTYTGNSTSDPSSATQTISSLQFQPDLVITKGRNLDNAWEVYDSIRGTEKAVRMQLTNTERTVSDSLTSFNSNGFTLGSSFASNRASFDHISYSFKAGGAAVSNTDGTITSQVSANQDAGFSIVKWTNNSNSSDTIGHGLNSAPELYITKRLPSPSNWYTYTTAIDGSLDYLVLNDTSVANNSSSAVPTTNVFTSDHTNNENMIAYCFHSVDSYQRIGSYTGNDSSKRIYTDSNGDGTGTGGFAPRFLLIKCSSNSGTNKEWNIFDTTRDPSPINQRLEANTNDIEFTDTSNITINSDGFTLGDNGAATGSINQIGFDYIYLAIA